MRITNNGAVPTSARLNLWSVPLSPLGVPDWQNANWTARAANLDTPINAGGMAYARVDWNTPGDPNPGDDFKAYALIAVIQSADAADPAPQLANITDLASFWDFFDTFVRSDNAALRVLGWQT